MEAKQFFQYGPHSNSETAFVEVMGGRFLLLVTKLGKATILHSSLLKPIYCPNLVFNDQPRKYLTYDLEHVKLACTDYIERPTENVNMILRLFRNF
jgi:hypothetical protein